ncbi:RNA exonuclease [Raphidocelis subcapitata]|uniref:RNA exonuclease n=1 Tax=Raphidocelis subcapitata TaxID=307507 RepID=A0A2V0P7N0_9CHLO|nr:RNA exonuclease [Raphidocelis subcapitata]|eukprot:GBF94932.1 RNA exonuclease [Raphidocelis subcapitata]
MAGGGGGGSGAGGSGNFYAALMNLRVSEDGSGSPTFAGMSSNGGAKRASVLAAAAKAPAPTASGSRSGKEAAARKGAAAAAHDGQEAPADSKAAAGAGDAAGKPSDGSSSGGGGGDDAAAPQPKEAGESKAAAAAATAKRRRLPNPLVWIDLEMTGLDVDKDTIIEIACLVTDGDLKTVVEGPSIAIHHGEDVIDSMNDWCKEHHGKSGLTERVRESTVSLEEAEVQVLEFVAAHTDYQTAQLAGNSVHVDRAFLMRRMPRLLEHLHYRIVDVSSIAEVARRWSPKLARSAPRKKAAHTAMSDIRESLEELRYYKEKLFRAHK